MAPLAVPSARDVLICSFMLIIVNTIFGGYSVITSSVLKGSTLNATVFAFLRDVFGSLILLIWAYIYESRQARPMFWIAKQDVGQLMLVGLFMVWGAQGCSALAIANLTPVVFSMSQPAMPVVTVGLSLVVGYERFSVREWTSWGKIIGILVTVAGAVMMVVLSQHSSSAGESKNFGLGVFYMALQVIMGGSLHVAMKPLLSTYSSITACAWGYVAGTGLLLLSVLTSATEAADWEITPLGVAGIAYSSILSSAVAYAMMTYVNKRTQPALIATFMPLQALSAALLAWAILGQTLDAATYAGGGVIVAGLLIVVYCRYIEGARLASPDAYKAVGSGDDDDDREEGLEDSLVGRDVVVISLNRAGKRIELAGSR